ncbi:MAG: hypothetical protein Q9172_001080 [Xanthocarpia lactea]
MRSLSTTRPDPIAQKKRSKSASGYTNNSVRRNEDDILRSQILTLEWPPGVVPSELSNFESEARRLRYQALGKACHDAKIPSLLFGHHKADEKETLIMRLIEGYRGEGLRGIPAESDIPDCQGIYGAYRSGGRGYTTTLNASAKALALKRKGMAQMLPPAEEYREPGFEYGGVRIYRPLLRFSKRTLQSTLNDASIPWVEDPTNQDPTVSVRNAIRFLTQAGLLPKALSDPPHGDGYTLEIAAKNIRRKYQSRNDYADALFQACDIISFDARAGSLEVRVPTFADLKIPGDSFWRSPRSHWAFEREHIAARLVRLLLQLVTPKDHISLQSLETATKRMFFDSEKSYPGRGKTCTPSAVFTAGGVYCERVDSSIDDLKDLVQHTWRLSRQPYRLDSPEPECNLPPARPLPQNPKAKKQRPIASPDMPWQLWDGRYWVQVINGTSKPLKICPLTEDRLHLLKARVRAEDCQGTKRSAFLQGTLRAAAPGSLRFTLPAIVDEDDNVLVLPTLGFEFESLGIEWRIRYRRVVFPDNIKEEAVIALPEKELMV